MFKWVQFCAIVILQKKRGKVNCLTPAKGGIAMLKQNNRFNIRTLVLLGLLSALVFALSWVSLPVGDISRIHFGNIMCLLSGLLFGPFIGGFASGLGSMLFDFTNPLFISEFWITFITKFAMGFLAGWMYRYGLRHVHEKLRLVLSGLSGSLLYVVLYLCKGAIISHFVKGIPWSGVWVDLSIKAVSSTINGAIAVAGSVLLAMALRPALERAGVFRNNKVRHTP